LKRISFRYLFLIVVEIENWLKKKALVLWHKHLANVTRLNILPETSFCTSLFQFQGQPLPEYHIHSKNEIWNKEESHIVCEKNGWREFLFVLLCWQILNEGNISEM
jgi:hypothetical protein